MILNASEWLNMMEDLSVVTRCRAWDGLRAHHGQRVIAKGEEGARVDTMPMCTSQAKLSCHVTQDTQTHAKHNANLDTFS